MTKETEDIQNIEQTELEQPDQPQSVKVLDEQPLPKALSTLVNNSNRQLQETQQRLMDEINECSAELMEMLSLRREDGWYLDIQGQRFVKLELPQPTE
jgi:hypothetical protein